MAQSKSTPHRKEARASSWKRGKERKEARKAEQKRREQKNLELRRSGGLTPWELAKEQAKQRRAAKRAGAE